MDFPIKNGDFPWQNVSSPEGKPIQQTIVRYTVFPQKPIDPAMTWGLVQMSFHSKFFVEVQGQQVNLPEGIIFINNWLLLIING